MTKPESLTFINYDESLFLLVCHARRKRKPLTSEILAARFIYGHARWAFTASSL